MTARPYNDCSDPLNEITDAEFDEFLHSPDTDIFVAYDWDIYVKRTWLGYAKAKSFRDKFEPGELPAQTQIKQAVRAAKAKWWHRSPVRIGQTFVLQPVGKKYAALAAWGAPCGNLQGHNFTDQDIDFVLQQDNVTAVVFDQFGVGTYYELDAQDAG